MAETVRPLTDKKRIPGALSCAAAFGVALIHPLIFHNCFFDINRFKAAAYVFSAGACLAVFLVCSAVFRGFSKPKFRLPDAFMAAFVLFAALSTVLSDNPSFALTGSDGRQTGLVFVLALGAYYAVASRDRRAGRWAATGLMISGLPVSALGVLNFFRVDPLGFYERMREKDVEAFLSTIGNVDFFGVFIAFVLAAAAALFVCEDTPLRRALAGANLALGAAAAVAARTDGALLALVFAAFVLFLSAAPSRKKRNRALTGLACLSFSLCLTGAALRAFPGRAMSVAGLRSEFLTKNPLLSGGAGAAFVLLRIFFGRKAELRVSPRVWRRTLVFTALFLAALAAAGLIYFTWIDRETYLPGAFSLLRFGDRWGSNRGGVWTRCLRLYASESARVKLIGFGPDCLRKPLADAYGKEIAAYCNLKFNNAHNEYIQYLLTQGALGLLSYLGFAVSCLRIHARRAKNDVFSAAQLAGAAAGLLIAAFNVNQPITTPILFMLLTAGAAAGDNADRL